MSTLSNERLQQDVIATIADVIQKQPSSIHVGQSLAHDLSIDSIQLLEVIAVLEERFQLEVEPDELEPEVFRSVQAVVRYVERKLKA